MVALICYYNQLFVKPTDAGRRLLGMPRLSGGFAALQLPHPIGSVLTTASSNQTRLLWPPASLSVM